jgi:hypothetical protein
MIINIVIMGIWYAVIKALYKIYLTAILLSCYAYPAILLHTILFYILHIVFWVLNCPNFRLVVLNLLVLLCRALLYIKSIDLMHNDYSDGRYRVLGIQYQWYHKQRYRYRLLTWYRSILAPFKTTCLISLLGWIRLNEPLK